MASDHSQDAYSRVYRYIMRDPKFKRVYQDKEALGWWLSLLLIADSMWPDPAPLPYGIKETVLAKLTQDDIVLVDSDTYMYRIKGLDKERAARSKQASDAAKSRWESDRNADAMRPHSDRIQPKDAPASKTDGVRSERDNVVMRPHSDRISSADAEPMPRRDETRRDETRHASAREPDALLAYNEATARRPVGWVLERINDMARAFGEAETARAIQDAWLADIGAKPSVHLNAAETLLMSRAKAAEAARKKAAAEERRKEAERMANATPEERARAEETKAMVDAIVKGMVA